MERTRERPTTTTTMAVLLAVVTTVGCGARRGRISWPVALGAESAEVVR
jgi:hypothetical protein